MPWEVTGPVRERERFIEAYLTGFYTITELAGRFGMSRQQLHKWLARHNVDGMKGLVDRSRAPLHIPHRTSDEITEQIIAFRRRFPYMGPRKIIARLTELHPDVEWPAPSTAGDILHRANLVQPRERRTPPAHPLRVRSEPVEPNDLMTVDYKGQFLLGNHRYCYPLTVVDHVSRYLLACEAYPSCEGPHTRRAFERIFREYGLPRAILSDNGSPFGSPGLARLSRLSLWWIRLGIAVERIVPGHPEQNGAHERMHRTLKAETTRPPDQSMEGQQKRFDEFRHTYNHERPHETLGQKRPATIYRPSPRPYPETLPPIEYSGHLETRKVGQNGMMRWKNGVIFTSKTLCGEWVGLEEIDDGVWSLYYGPVLLARFDEREMRFYG
jgi:transposase InsO family protein